MSCPACGGGSDHACDGRCSHCHGIEPVEGPAIPRPSVRITSMEPLKVLQQCKKAALAADVSLAFWVEFTATAWACLTPDCEPEEIAKFMDVVRERFHVT